MRIKGLQFEISFKNIWIIAKAELKKFFDSPTAYIALIIFLAVWEFLFFKTAFLINEASLRMLFANLPWLALFLCSAISMGSVSQEKSQGTLEFLLTHPIRSQEVVLGKLLASFIYTAIGILLTLPIAFSFSAAGALDWGIIASQYLASFLLLIFFLSLGICISSLFSSQIAALLVILAISLALVLLGSEIITMSLPFWLGNYLSKIAIFSHYESISRGLIQLKDIWYFISFSAIFLCFAWWQLTRVKNSKEKIRNSLPKMIILGAAVFILLTNFFSDYIPGSLDVTQNRIYTLTASTKKIISSLDENVSITVYATELPSQLQSVLQDTKDTLRDYKSQSKGKINLFFKDPSKDQTIEQEAVNGGIQKMQFNVVEKDQFQVKNGFFGLVVKTSENQEVMPFIQDTSSLEYELTGIIKQLTNKDRKVVYFLGEGSPHDLSGDYSYFNQELTKQFDVKTLPEGTKVPSDAASIVIQGPSQEIAQTSMDAIKQYLNKGGSALFLIDSVLISSQGLTTIENTASLADFLAINYGIIVDNNIVYDLKAHENISFSNGMFSYILPYPFWVTSKAVKTDIPFTAKIESLVLPWPSSISLNQTKLGENGLAVTNLFTTTEYASFQSSTSSSISPEQNLPSNNLSQKVLAVLAKKASQAETSQAISQATPRLIVVGDSDFLSNSVIQQSAENLAFGLEAISWLANEDSLASIPLKNYSRNQLSFESPNQATAIKYGNLIFVILGPALFAVIHLLRRRSLKTRTYK